jgi:hypothetical protein
VNVAEIVGVALDAAHDGRIDVESDRREKPLLCCIKQCLEFFFGAVPGPSPVEDKRVCASALTIVDRPHHRRPVIRVAERVRQVEGLPRVPRFRIEPGVVEGKDEPFPFGLGRDGVTGEGRLVFRNAKIVSNQGNLSACRLRERGEDTTGLWPGQGEQVGRWNATAQRCS